MEYSGNQVVERELSLILLMVTYVCACPRACGAPSSVKY